MASLGGNAIHVATGVFVNGVSPITVARKGEDFPATALEIFRRSGLSTDFMVPISGPTVRNWVIYEWDGSRTWLYRTPKTRSLEVSPEPEDLTDQVLKGVGVAHIAAMPLGNAERLVERLRELAPAIKIVLDTHEDWIDGYQERLIALARAVNYFVPSKEELIVLMGTSDLEFAMAKLETYEIGNVIVKAGAQGAFLIENAVTHHIKAIKVSVKDTTGAGDAFCGGLTAGIALGLSLHDSVKMGCETAGRAIANSGSLRLLEN